MNTSLTVLPLSSPEPYKTDKTYHVSNDEFLRTVFGEELTDARPMLVSVKGCPAKATSRSWVGRVWQVGKTIIPTDANNYFSLAVFLPNESGEYRRQKANYYATHALMLDDIGTKADINRMTLQPNWLLETSLGNYQAGYIFKDPLTDGVIADQLNKATIASGLCDPGANGIHSRLARLPEGVNGKHTPAFECRMVMWNPELRYSVQELVEGLHLDLTQTTRPARPKRQNSNKAQARPVDGDPVHIQKPKENPVLIALREQGFYKATLWSGKHDVTCPWVNEHTGADDDGSAYFEPNSEWLIGGFKCHHGHCAGRNIRDLLEILGLDIESTRTQTTIRVINGQIHRVVDAAEMELATSGQFYQQGGLIIEVITDPGTLEIRVQDVNQFALVKALAGIAIWEKYDARSESWVRIDPPGRHLAVLFDSNTYNHLPILKSLTRQPYLRPDGTLMTTAGYDAATQMYGVFESSAFSVVDKPSRADAVLALITLNDLLTEFSFAGEVDRAAALSAMLTAAIRPSLPLAPMFHIRAHMPGSGKSYLCELITAIATPKRGTPSSFPANDEECGKMLLATLQPNPAVIEYDNLATDLMAHKSLCTVLTSEYFSGRILGISKMATVITRTLFLSSGNNVGPINDMSRRCITINLSPQCETPATRDYKRPNLINEVLRERGKYVSAALTIVLAWIEAGRPRTEAKSLASYGEWSDYCRQSLLWLGCADPASSVFDAMAEDPDRETLARLLTSWRAVFVNRPAMVRDAVKQAGWEIDSNVELKEVLHDIADERGEINRRRLGWWIKRHAGQIVDGMRFIKAPGNRSADAWTVESVFPVLPIDPQVIQKSVSNSECTPNDYARASRGE